MNEKNVRVGVGVFVCKDGAFAMQCRQGSHGAGTWSVAGGHLEFGETFEQTAQREVAEELGIEIKNVRFGAVTNDYFPDEDKHYVTIWMLSDWANGEARIMEPDKCSAIDWYTFENLPSPLFLAWNQLLASEFIDTIKQQLNA